MDLRTELNKFTKKITKEINYKNNYIKLDLIDYHDKKVIDILNEWKICLSFMGKSKLLKDTYVAEIIFCLLSDYHYVHTIGRKESPLHLYNPFLDDLTNLVVVDQNRCIKFKLFNISNTLIVFDFKKDHYKIYKLYGLDVIKEYYETKQIKFDHLVKDLQLTPIFESNLDNIEKDYQKLSYINYTKAIVLEIRYNTLMQYYQLYEKIDQKIEKEIDLLYKNLLHDRDIITGGV
ncbi:hypothetical protein Klosneuvirus_4_21 [Klosneuvirus KNV1]|uniref:Uncharacterized protein n=1 Tax=Klosneuvirus KNV1 TaxID=1977640 RepID=A0A1V0SKH1_9VIRU|nr:hypothetical protein Klosneuvirus_4_21 [Klosneuvirus KNV1]